MKSPLYAVIDTNVIVSALLSRKNDSATVLILRSIFEGFIIPIINQEILKEYREVLHRTKFKFEYSLVEDLVQSIQELGIDAPRTQEQEAFPSCPESCQPVRDAHLDFDEIK